MFFKDKTIKKKVKHEYIKNIFFNLCIDKKFYSVNYGDYY